MQFDSVRFELSWSCLGADWVWPSAGRCLQIANWFLSISHNQNYYGEHKISLGSLLLTSRVAASLLSRTESWFYNLISVRKLHERPTCPGPQIPGTPQPSDIDVLAYAYKFVDYQSFFNEFGEAAAAPIRVVESRTGHWRAALLPANVHMYTHMQQCRRTLYLSWWAPTRTQRVIPQLVGDRQSGWGGALCAVCMWRPHGEDGRDRGVWPRLQGRYSHKTAWQEPLELLKGLGIYLKAITIRQIIAKLLQYFSEFWYKVVFKGR